MFVGGLQARIAGEVERRRRARLDGELQTFKSVERGLVAQIGKVDEHLAVGIAESRGFPFGSPIAFAVPGHATLGLSTCSERARAKL